MESFISKSPKVESLNTNPECKIYPILTHARGTEVYNQFTYLSRQILQEVRETAEPRSLLFHGWQTSEEERKKANYNVRLSRLKPSCLLCTRTLDANSSGSISFYYESSDGGACGFLDEDCFITFLLSTIYNLDKKSGSDDQIRLMFQDSAKESVFAFKPLENGQGSVVEFYRFSLQGNMLAKKTFPLKEYEGSLLSREKSRLFTLMSDTLEEANGKMRDAILVIYPLRSKNPETILLDENYKPLSKIVNHIAGQLGAGHHLASLEA
jgi:hypothetical protein